MLDLKRNLNGTTYDKPLQITWCGAMRFFSTASRLFFTRSVCSWYFGYLHTCHTEAHVFRPSLRSLLALGSKVGRHSCVLICIISALIKADALVE